MTIMQVLEQKIFSPEYNIFIFMFHGLVLYMHQLWVVCVDFLLHAAAQTPQSFKKDGIQSDLTSI